MSIPKQKNVFNIFLKVIKGHIDLNFEVFLEYNLSLKKSVELYSLFNEMWSIRMNRF